MLTETPVRALTILTVWLLLFGLASCGRADEPERVTFDVAHTSDRLEQATVDIVGRPPGEASLDDVERELRTSVRDMSELSEKEYREEYGRSPLDQASLDGTWVGLATNELPGRARRERLDNLATDLSGAAPNESSDNPRNPNAENARTLYQSSYAFARERG